MSLAIFAKSLFASTLIAVAGQAASAAPIWSAFAIRNVANPTTVLAPVGQADGSAFTVTIDEGNEKAGYGTTFFNGQALSTVGSVSYARSDAGSKSPYLNIWITDGSNYAIIAPMPNMQVGGGYTSNNPNGIDIQSRGFNIHETNTSNLAWLGVAGTVEIGNQAVVYSSGKVPVLVSDLGSNLTVYGNSTLGGTGAPKNGTGFNLVFGDLQGNFVDPLAYELTNVSVTAVPEPATIGLLGVAAMGLLARRRRAV